MIERTRARQVRNLLLTLMVSRGVPMLLGGDEFRRTQNGNNNAYCQDNTTSWFDWDRKDANEDLVDFTRRAIQLRRSLPVFSSGSYYLPSDVEWFDARGRSLDWHNADQRTLGMHIRAAEGQDVVTVLHAGANSVNVLLPPPPLDYEWHRVADTARVHPDDCLTVDTAVAIDAPDRYVMSGRSMIVLVAKPSAQ